MSGSIHAYVSLLQAINPGQPLLPDWVHNGAIIGVQGGTDRMLEVLNEVNFPQIYIQISFSDQNSLN